MNRVRIGHATSIRAHCVCAAPDRNSSTTLRSRRIDSQEVEFEPRQTPTSKTVAYTALYFQSSLCRDSLHSLNQLPSHIDIPKTAEHPCSRRLSKVLETASPKGDRDQVLELRSLCTMRRNPRGATDQKARFERELSGVRRLPSPSPLLESVPNERIDGSTRRHGRTSSWMKSSSLAPRPAANGDVSYRRARTATFSPVSSASAAIALYARSRCTRMKRAKRIRTVVPSNPVRTVFPKLKSRKCPSRVPAAE
nr:hypothetical protein CFP56_11778 [Quercus suber]